MRMREMLQEQQAQKRNIANNNTQEELKIMNQILKKNTEAIEKEKRDKLNYRERL